MAINPYAPPAATAADIQPTEGAPALWNPNAAVNWSLLFTPAFGAFLHMSNWQALGETEKAASANRWFIFSLIMLVAYAVLGFALMDSKAADGVSRMVGGLYLFAWYFAAAKGQARYVKERFGTTYPRKGWGKPLAIGVLAFIGYVVAIALVGFLFGVAG
jgi:hypothetical protein